MPPPPPPALLEPPPPPAPCRMSVLGLRRGRYLYSGCSFMWRARRRLASSMNGLLSSSLSFFHSLPRRLLISELCIFGLSWAILRRWPRDHTMNAFIGRFTWSPAPPPAAAAAATAAAIELADDDESDVDDDDDDDELAAAAAAAAAATTAAFIALVRLDLAPPPTPFTLRLLLLPPLARCAPTRPFGPWPSSRPPPFGPVI